MNNLQRDKRHSRGRKARLEYLETRIVPAAIHPTPVVAADVASASVSAHSQQHREDTIAGDSEIQIRHERRVAEIAERREAALERRERRLSELAAHYRARHDIILAAPAQNQVIPVSSSNSTPATTAQGTSGSSPSGSGTGSSAGSTVGGTSPASPAPTSTSSGSGNSLPANVSVLLDTVYEKYENGDLPSPTMQPGQVEIQGSTVGVQIHASNPSDFDTMVADAESLGLQMTDVSDAYDIVVGYLPIAELPSAAQLPGSPSIAPLLYPITN